MHWEKADVPWTRKQLCGSGGQEVHLVEMNCDGFNLRLQISLLFSFNQEASSISPPFEFEYL